ncbi:MAG: error-prone DNA polymerase, partial [Thermomicrobiales bacterium]|nr:error-prone DNA polymerase [Thermomicrobiales bacterium]
PLGLLRARLPSDFATTADLATLPDGLRVRVGGLVVCRQRPGAANGITFLLLEDELGLINIVVFPALYEEQRHIVRGEPFLLVEGRLQRRNNTLNLVAERIAPLTAARDEFARPAERIDAEQVAILVERATRPHEDARALALGAIAPASHDYR